MEHKFPSVPPYPPIPKAPTHRPSPHHRLTRTQNLSPQQDSSIEEKMINSMQGTPPLEIIKQYEKYLHQIDNNEPKDSQIEKILATALKESFINVFKNDSLALYRQIFDNMKEPFSHRIKAHKNNIKTINREANVRLLPVEKQKIKKSKIEIFKLTAMNLALKEAEATMNKQS